ncbi:MAG: hypothetical protein JXR07_08900 [Reichenbachiella sp.]
MFSLLASGQINKNTDYKTHKVKIKADRFVFYNNNMFYTQNDTIVYFADTLDFYIKRNSMERTDAFYDSLEHNMNKAKVSKVLYESIFLSQDTTKHQPDFNSAFRFLQHSEKEISKINLKHLPVFGSHIEDTTLNDPDGAGRFFNKIHTHTRPNIIRKNLTFSKGDELDPYELIDSERLLRSLNFIQDARIYVDTLSTGEVKLDVVTKDLLPWNVELGPLEYERSLFSVSYNNIAGLGHEFEYVLVTENDLNLRPGSDFYYRVPSILGSYTLLQLNYSSLFKTQGLGMKFDRQFETQEMKYAGGIEIADYTRGLVDYYEFEQDTASALYYDETIVDPWFGRAFQSNMRLGIFGLTSRTNIVVSGRYDYRDLYDKPIVSADSNYRFHSYQNLLFGIGINSRKFYTDNFVLNFGRTEDVPSGGALGAVVGYQFGEFKDRPYLGFNYARGGYLRQFGYLNVFSEFGGFITNEDDAPSIYEDAVIKLGADYFSKLFLFNQSKYRQFISFTWKHMINPREPAYLSSEKEIGIRGLRRYATSATDQLNFRWESLVFTPVSLIGFRMACFAYADITSMRNITIDNSWELYSGIGLGVQLRNDETSLNTIVIRLSYFPSIPDGGKQTYFGLNSSSPLKIRDFNFSAPSVTTF